MKTLVYIAVAMTLFACDSSTYYDDMEAIGNDGWKQDKFIEQTVDIEDAEEQFDVYLNIRNTKDYQYWNLFVFLDIEDPDGEVWKDTVELTISDENGKWTSEDVSETYVMNSFRTYQDYTFPKPGKYTFKLSHGMYDDPLIGISDVGIRLEKK